MPSRRKLLKSLPALVLATRRLHAAPMPPPEATRIYLGTGTRGPGKGILTASWNAATGEIGPLTLAAEVIRPTFLAQFRRGSEVSLYSVSEVSGPDAKVSAFLTTGQSAALKPLNQQSTAGDGPTHVAVSLAGDAVFVANYGSGSVTSFGVLPDRSLSAPVSHFQFTGSGPYAGRQEGPHTHAVTPSPDGRFLLVNDLGLDRIMVYRIVPRTAELVAVDPPFWQARPGTGPRHLAWAPGGRFVFCTNELDSTVDTLAWNPATATLRSIGFASSLPKDFTPNKAFVGEIAASRDGRNVYAGNRVADDTIGVFAVDPHTHALTLTQSANVGGKNARHIALDPTDRWMVIAHQESNDLTVVSRDPRTGALSPPHPHLPRPHPHVHPLRVNPRLSTAPA